MHSTLDTYCPKCYRPFAWEKIGYMRQDHYYDWRIDVWCQCGECDDPKIHKLAHYAYYRKQRSMARRMQNGILNEKLGKDLHRAIEDLLWRKLLSESVTFLFTAGFEHGPLPGQDKESLPV